MNRLPASVRRLLPWLLIPAAWLLVALISSMVPAQEITMEGAIRRMAWSEVIREQIRLYAGWVILTPVVIWLARRFPLHSPRWWRAVLVHVPAAVLVGVAVAYLRMLPLESLLGVELSRWRVQLSAVPSMLPGALTAYWTIVAIVTALDSYRTSQQKQREAVALSAQLSEAKLAMLRMQLEPHFLFNTLNTISALVDWRPADARRMITSLSELLRDTLEADAREIVPLDEEIDWIERYLEIQQIRFADRLDVRIDIAPEVRHAHVPSLVLQPLVENAIKHGLEPTDRHVTLELTAAAVGDRLRLVVRDNGAGVKPGSAERVGLRTTRERLETLYHAKQTLQLTPLDPGMQAVIEIPLSTNGTNGTSGTNGAWNPTAS